ncbi:hypothetical protein T484DRAFT_1777178 [Baffinella frigidus]|nr:hypothetical protein T484DRAFT_1777178 [Cryptophyta sp. CCMP2293]
MDMATDHYAVLGLEYGATREEIKKAHRKLALRYHPDKVAAKGGHPDKEAAKFRAIQESYEVLADEDAKAAYHALEEVPEQASRAANARGWAAREHAREKAKAREQNEAREKAAWEKAAWEEELREKDARRKDELEKAARAEREMAREQDAARERDALERREKAAREKKAWKKAIREKERREVEKEAERKVAMEQAARAGGSIREEEQRERENQARGKAVAHAARTHSEEAAGGSPKSREGMGLAARLLSGSFFSSLANRGKEWGEQEKETRQPAVHQAAALERREKAARAQRAEAWEQDARDMERACSLSQRECEEEQNELERALRLSVEQEELERALRTSQEQEEEEEQEEQEELERALRVSQWGGDAEQEEVAELWEELFRDARQPAPLRPYG